jgi:hypothetical protein
MKIEITNNYTWANMQLGEKALFINGEFVKKGRKKELIDKVTKLIEAWIE